MTHSSIGVYTKSSSRFHITSVLESFYCTAVLIHLAAWIFMPENNLRFLIYIPFLAIFGLYLIFGRPVGIGILVFPFVFILVNLTSFVFGGRLHSEYFFRDMLLIFLGIIPFFLRWNFHSGHLSLLLLAITFIGVIDVVHRSEGFPFSMSLLSSYAPTEANVALVLGAFVVFFVQRGQFVRAVLPVLLTVIFFKRIGIIASVVVWVLSFILLYTNMIGTYKRRLMLIISAFGLFIVISLVQSSLYDFVAKTIPGVPIEVVTMGRSRLVEVFLTELLNSDWLEIFLGHGSGTASELAYTISGLSHPHSDYLRLVYDVGVIGTVLLLMALSASLAQTVAGALVGVYLACLFLTDNVLVYVGYQWVFAAIARYSVGTRAYHVKDISLKI